MRSEIGAVTAGLLDGLDELSIGKVSTFAFENEIGCFQFFVFVAIDNQVGKVIWRAPGNSNFKADAFGAVVVFVDQFSPKLGPDLFFRVSPPF